MPTKLTRSWRALRRLMRAARQLATDKRIPHWVRILLGIGLVQTPLPVDEVALALALLIIATRYRVALTDAVATAKGSRQP